MALGACAKDISQEDLGHACQLKPCACFDDEFRPFQNSKPAEMLWRDTGEAYCPPGHHLERTDKEE